MMKGWTEPDTRDEVVDFIAFKKSQTGLSESHLLKLLKFDRKKFYTWKQAYGRPWLYSCNLPSLEQITEQEKEAVINFYKEHPNDGYRRCAYLMIDQDIAYIQPSSVYRILTEAGVMRSRTAKISSKGNGFTQPLAAHEQWHSDITNVTCGDTVYHLISIIDGYSRAVIAWSLREKMKTKDVNIVFQKATELFPEETPRCITDNGSQYKSREFTQFIARNQYSHTTTAPYYPQSNGKQERFHGSLKSECIRVMAPMNKADAERIIDQYVKYYNNQRLHSATSYVTPSDMLKGRQKQILELRDHKLKEAKIHRRKFNLNKKEKESNHKVEIKSA